MKCLMCRKDMCLEPSCYPEPPAKLTRSVAVDGGGTVEVSFGYGSALDCQTALGFICDACFANNRDLFVNHYDGLARCVVGQPPTDRGDAP